MSLKTQLQRRVQSNGQDSLSIRSLMSQDSVKKRFEELLGNKAPGFMSSVLNIVNGNTDLQRCNPQQVLSSAAIAAALDLPIDPNLGFAYIVPYKSKGSVHAQFQMGYRGYIQLAMRTGMYKTINATHVFEGEIESFNRITGEVVFSETGAMSDKIVGYIAYFKLVNGFEKFEYWTVDQVKAHAERFSQAYRSGKGGPWQSDFNAMATKTVLKSLLSRYGVLSIEMQTAVKADQAVVSGQDEDGFDFEYVDNDGADGDIIDVTPVVDAEADAEDGEPSLFDGVESDKA